jgi:putative nucleotidyltransferase with HDIG domain
VINELKILVANRRVWVRRIGDAEMSPVIGFVHCLTRYSSGGRYRVICDRFFMLKRIPITELRLGMYIHELCGSWLDHPFWRGSFQLSDEKDLHQIVESSITEVWIDPERGLDTAGGVSSGASDAQVATYIANVVDRQVARSPVSKRVSMRDELETAAKLCATSRTAVADMFREARMGQAIDAERADALVGEIAASVMRNPDALISVARLKTVDDYTYMHSIAVCALMIALARKLGMAEKDVREAGLAGMLHDVGKMMIPSAILNKPGKLTDEEFTCIKTHPAEGHRMLQQGGGVSAMVLDVCLHHHEKMDGSGYPERLKGEQISLIAKMGAVCDVYDAITSDRPYKKGWDPAEALRKMAEWKNGHFDDAVFGAFVKSMGIYPVGSLVRMQSGRLGVIVEQSGQSLLTPKVKLFFSTKSQERIVPYVVDLADAKTTDRIASREDPEKWRFPDLATL